MEIAAKRRQVFGKKTKKLRNERKLPTVMFGKGIDSQSLTVDLNQFIKVYNEAGETSLVDLKIDGRTEKVLIKEVQTHPVSSSIFHASFHKVNLKETIAAEVPVEIIGEEENALVKSGQALILVLLNEILVEALPTDLLSSFVVDVSGLQEIGDGVTVDKLVYDRKKVEILGHEPEDFVVKLDYATIQEEEEEKAVVSEEELVEGIEATEETESEASEETEEQD